MSHNTIILLLVGVLLLSVVATVVRPHCSLQPAATLVTAIGSAILVAVLANVALVKAVEALVGKPPIMPPFLSARIIEDGPGYWHAKSHCPDSGYEICKYLDRLPLTMAEYLWRLDPERSLFATVDADTRRALSDEQPRFVMNAIAEYPGSQLKRSLMNAGAQVIKFDLGEFNYTPRRREFFEKKLPPEYFDTMIKTAAYRGAIPVRLLSGLQRLILILALGYSAVLLFVVFRSRNRDGSEIGEPGAGRLLVFCALVFVGILLNAAICGALSSAIGRYQARVIWLVPLTALLLDMSLRQSSWHDFLGRRGRCRRPPTASP